MAETPPHLLFSYGTLRQPEVQQALFGRIVATDPDALTGYALSTVVIADPAVVAASGSAVHPILTATGNADDVVEGAALGLTDTDLAAADAYEDAAYVRVTARLRSGRTAFVYVRA